MLRAVKGLKIKPQLLLIDGNVTIFSEIPQQTVVKGDTKYGNIASASIIAKVTRDTVMERFHVQYPAYSFDKNKGYGTGEHLKALDELGPCPIHRFSFNGVGQLRLPI
jgi:ribonuclease HII